LIVYDPTNEKEAKEVDSLYSRMIERALKVEGTCTGEVIRQFINSSTLIFF